MKETKARGRAQNLILQNDQPKLGRRAGGVIEKDGRKGIRKKKELPLSI